MEQLQYRSLRENIDRVITPELTKLTGFIFNYDESSLNTSLFTNYLWISASENEGIDSFISRALESLKQKRIDFEEVKSELQLHWEEELGGIYSYYIENFEKISMFFDLLELYIPIEAQKITLFLDGRSIFQSEELLQEHIANIENIEAKIFWEKLSDRPESAKQVLDYMKNSFLECTDLTEEEQSFMRGILSELSEKYPSNQNTEIDVWSDTMLSEELLLSDPLNIDDKKAHLEMDVPQEQYVEVLRGL